MPDVLMRDQRIWLGGYEIASTMNSISLARESELQDNTTFGQKTRTAVGGLETITFGASGNVDPQVVDQVLFEAIGVANQPVSIAPLDAKDLDPAYLFEAILGEYSPGGSVGELLAYALSAQSAAGRVLAKGGILAIRSAQAASDVGSAVQLGPVAAGELAVAAAHVTRVASASDSIELAIQSASDQAFTGPTTRATFTAASAIGGQLLEIAGPVTDPWWRATWTITDGSGTPEFDFTVTSGG